MDMKELGGFLQTEREKQGLTLDEVHESTKISKSALRSLEAGLAEDLPHPVYTKGFIKNYAELLGLDADQLVVEFSRNLSREGQYEEMEEAHQAVMDAESEKKAGRGVVLSIAATVILLAVLGWLVYDLFFKSPAEVGSSAKEQDIAALNATRQGEEAQSKKTETPVEPASPETATESVKPPESADPRPPEKPQSQKMSQPKAGPVTPDKPDQGGIQKPPAPQRGRNATPAAGVPAGNKTTALKPKKITYAPENRSQGDNQAQPGAPAANAQKHALRIEAVEACWFEAQVDGANKDIYLQPGESVTLTFANDLQVRLGNAGGVDLFFDGERYPLQASSGEVKTVAFP